MATFILTVFFYLWMAGTVVMLARIYRALLHYIEHMEETMLASRAVSAEAARKSAESAARLVEMLQEERGSHAT